MKDENFTIQTLTNSKEIGKALANDTARQILEILFNGSLSTAQISQKLGKPLTTVDYALKMLLKSQLVKPDKYTWSEKGRIARLYSLQDKYIIITPRKQENVADVLKKFLPVIFGIVVVSTFLELIYATTFVQLGSLGETLSRAPAEVITKPTAVQNLHYGIIFLILSLGLLILYILARYRVFSLRKFS